MTGTFIPPDFHGWWRIVETGAWVDREIDIIETAMILLTGDEVLCSDARKF